MATYKAAKQQWMRGFLEAGICSTEQLRFGLMQARQAAKDFVPNVGRFTGERRQRVIAQCIEVAQAALLQRVEKLS